MSTTFSGHTTRSTGEVICSVASTWRAKTSRGSVSAARVFCLPPPCTTATRRSPTACPSGATRENAHSASTPARVTAPTAQRRSQRAERATPTTPTASTTPMAHTTRATWPRGAAAWLMAVVARGTPPNGNVQRAASASTRAPGRAIQRAHGPGRAARDHGAGDPDVGAEHRDGHRVAGEGHVLHPQHRRPQPRHAEQPGHARSATRPGGRRGAGPRGRRRRRPGATTPTGAPTRPGRARPARRPRPRPPWGGSGGGRGRARPPMMAAPSPRGVVPPGRARRCHRRAQAAPAARRSRRRSTTSRTVSTTKKTATAVPAMVAPAAVSKW